MKRAVVFGVLFGLAGEVLGEGEALLGKKFESSVGMGLVPIPAGSFLMGSPEGEVSRRDDEKQVEVTISKGFLMGEAEVTQGEWMAVMKTGFQEQIESKAGPLGRGANLVLEPSAEGDEEPMCFVNWGDAVAFCEKLTVLDREAGLLPEGFVYGLPTEAEWEYACRAGTTTVFAFGDTLTAMQANFYGPKPYGVEEEGEYREKTVPVKSFEANGWGLFDVHGNLYEWCADYYGEVLAGGADPAGPGEGEGRVIRGGTWNRTATSCRSAYRYSAGPESRSYNIGFRVVLRAE
ncbi:MAG: formylglycine-generating enzyme family protein [Verrucomicrobiota bacterium]